MQFPVNLVVEIRDQKEYDTVQDTLAFLRKSTESIVDDPSQLSTSLGLLDRTNYQLADGSKESRVTINGQPIAVGTKEEMLGRYRTECAMHQKSNVALQQWLNGDFKTLRARKLQKMA